MRSSATATLDGAEAAIASMLISGSGYAEDLPLAAVVRHALDVAGQLDQQGDRHVAGMLHLDDADAADLELAGDVRRRRGDQPVILPPDEGLVVADQRKSAVEQAQRQVGLAGARRAGDQHRAAVGGDGAGVDGFG